MIGPWSADHDMVMCSQYLRFPANVLQAKSVGSWQEVGSHDNVRSFHKDLQGPCLITGTDRIDHAL